MTHPDWNDGRPIPVRMTALDQMLGYQPFDVLACEFLWDERDSQWKEVLPPPLSPTLPALPQAEPLPIYLHIKTGGRYEVITRARLESDRNEEMVVYRSLVGGGVWVRPASEFDDGRFVWDGLVGGGE